MLESNQAQDQFLKADSILEVAMQNLETSSIKQARNRDKAGVVSQSFAHSSMAQPYPYPRPLPYPYQAYGPVHTLELCKAHSRLM